MNQTATTRKAITLLTAPLFIVFGVRLALTQAPGAR